LKYCSILIFCSNTKYPRYRYWWYERIKPKWYMILPIRRDEIAINGWYCQSWYQTFYGWYRHRYQDFMLTLCCSNGKELFFLCYRKFLNGRFMLTLNLFSVKNHLEQVISKISMGRKDTHSWITFPQMVSYHTKLFLNNFTQIPAPGTGEETRVEPWNKNY